jgi:hypothetical protein
MRGQFLVEVPLHQQYLQIHLWDIGKSPFIPYVNEASIWVNMAEYHNYPTTFSDSLKNIQFQEITWNYLPHCLRGKVNSLPYVNEHIMDQYG